MEYFLQLDFTLPIVYNNNMVKFTPTSINIRDRIGWKYGLCYSVTDIEEQFFPEKKQKKTTQPSRPTNNKKTKL